MLASGCASPWGGPTLPNAVSSARERVVSAQELLVSSSTGANWVTLAPPYAGSTPSPVSLPFGVPFLALTPGGVLAASGKTATILVAKAPYVRFAQLTLPSTVQGLAAGGPHAGYLFVASESASAKSGSITIFKPPFTIHNIVKTIALGSTPIGVTLSADGTLFVAEAKGTGATVAVYPPPYGDTPIASLSALPSPTTSDIFRLPMTTDARGNVFIGGTKSIVEFKPPFRNGNAPVATITSPVDVVTRLAVDRIGNLFVANLMGSATGDGTNNGYVTEFAPPYTKAPKSILQDVHFISSPTGLAVSAAGVLAVASAGGASGLTTVYSPSADGKYSTGKPVITDLYGSTSTLFVP